MENLYLFLTIIVYTIFILYVGFKSALLRWNQKENQTKLENYETLNNELTKVNKDYLALIEKINLTGKANRDWYIGQLENLSFYLKEKHNDKFLETQLFDVFNDTEKKIVIPGSEEEDLDINLILDKISKLGIESLTKKEKDFLNSNSDEDEE